MSSIVRINANRANAQKSTGPRTPEGKARVSQNALKHGLLAQAVVLPDECPRSFADAHAALTDQLQPQTWIDRELVEVMAAASWRRKRAWHLETVQYTEALRNQEEPNEDASRRTGLAYRTINDQSSVLKNLGRYEVRYSREFTRHLLLYEARRREAAHDLKISKQSQNQKTTDTQPSPAADPATPGTET